MSEIGILRQLRRTYAYGFSTFKPMNVQTIVRIKVVKYDSLEEHLIQSLRKENTKVDKDADPMIERRFYRIVGVTGRYTQNRRLRVSDCNRDITLASRFANRSQIHALDGLIFPLLLAGLADALPLQILPPNLIVDYDLLVLEQHHDVGSVEHEEAELVALLQLGSNLGGQIHRGNEAHPDRQHGD